MYTKTAPTGRWSLVGTAAVVCALFGGDALADGHNVSVAIQVSTQGLDLNQRADAQAFYVRLQNAAWVACTRGNRVNLVPVDDVTGCREEALGRAIRSAKMPMLTQIYLETHALQQAAKYGIEVPAQLAAK